MPVIGLDHILLAMPPDREADARAFYGGLLGIPEVRKPSNLEKRGGCWFACRGLKLHLGVEPHFRPARKAHPAFLVEHLADLVQRIAGAGFIVSTDEPLEGYERVFVDDPFGNRIELLEPTGTP